MVCAHKTGPVLWQGHCHSHDLAQFSGPRNLNQRLQLGMIQTVYEELQCKTINSIFQKILNF